MNGDALIWYLSSSWIVTCFVACGLRSLREFSHHDLEELSQRSSHSDRFSAIHRLEDETTAAVEYALVLTVTFFIFSAILYTIHSFEDLTKSGIVSVLFWTLGWGSLTAAATRWIPNSISRMYATSYLFYTWPIWQVIRWVVAPGVWAANLCDTMLHRIFGKSKQESEDDTFEDEIRTFVSEGHREGLLEEDAREMIEGVIDLADTDVAEIMTPRIDIDMIQKDKTWDEMLARVEKSGHTRIPVYNENRDDIIGVLYGKDLLSKLSMEENPKENLWSNLLRIPLFVPETKAVDDLLQDFQQSHTHIALVLDEYGGVAGLVTIEDVLEEIVGEIVDEYDEVIAEEITRISENSWEAMGRVHVDEINEEMGFDFPEDADFDTIGGFVFSELGHIPAVGETVCWHDKITITVLEATKRKIDRVLIEQTCDEQRDTA